MEGSDASIFFPFLNGEKWVVFCARPQILIEFIFKITPLILLLCILSLELVLSYSFLTILSGNVNTLT